jgi:cytochrome c-type protein NapC
MGQRFAAIISRRPILSALALFIAGVIFWGGFNTALEVTNTESFCISCHEMRDNVYKEYRKTVHYQNPTGVRATCPDCHVPKEWSYKVMRKIRATNELFHHFVGTINTPTKFEAERLSLAQLVWKNMKETDSRECRNCHDIDVMQLRKQSKRARVTHRRARKENRTCIDCHMGIAHKIAKEFDKDGSLHAEFKKTKRPCSDCHKGMPLPPDW